MVIRPISDLRNTNEISEQSHKINEPIFITKNGYGDMVIMSMEYYEKCIKGAQNRENENAAHTQYAPQTSADANRTHGKSNVNAAQGAGFNTPQTAAYAPVQESAADMPLYEKQSAVQNNESFEGIRHIREKYAKK